MAASTYPPPPPFYRLYKDYLENPDSAPGPPPPIEGPYMLYGANYTTDDVLPSLEEQGVRQLYPKGSNVDYKKELKALNRELLLQILELADVLVERPSQYARRVEDLGLIFKNLYHLLNSLRPHQARATLIHILELQIQRRKQAIEDIRRDPLLPTSSTPLVSSTFPQQFVPHCSIFRRREEARQLLRESLSALDGHLS